MSEVTSLQKFQEEENKKLKQISDMEGVDLGVARTMLDQSRNPTFPTLDQPVKTRQDWMNEVLLFDRQRAQQQSQPRQVSRPDFLAQARQEVRPQFDRAIGQLTQQVEGTRRQLPQQLASRGQALGGLRGQQEDTLTRDLAYGTADLRGQEEMAALQRADVLGQRFTEEQRYQDEVAFRERSFEEQQRMNQFSMQTTLQQLANEQDRFAYQQTRDAIGDEWQKIKFDEDVRARGVQEAIQQAQLGIQRANLALSQRQYEDSLASQGGQVGIDVNALKAYTNKLDEFGNDVQGLIGYIDNLYRMGQIGEAEVNYLRGLYGVAEQTTTTVSQVPTAQAIEGATGQTGVRTPTVPVRTTTVTTAFSPKEVPKLPELTLQKATEYLYESGLTPATMTDETQMRNAYETIFSLAQYEKIDIGTALVLYAQYGIDPNDFFDDEE
jgi:hypothetical protein